MTRVHSQCTLRVTTFRCERGFGSEGNWDLDSISVSIGSPVLVSVSGPLVDYVNAGLLNHDLLGRRRGNLRNLSDTKYQYRRFEYVLCV